MKRKLKFSERFALTSIAAAALCLASPAASALGLGRLSVQSSLGEVLRAEIDITSMTAEEQANLRIRIAPPESYRAANVDYNPVLPSTRATLEKRPDGRLFVRLISERGVQEPFVDVILEVSWATGRLVREYTLLFDPPTSIRAAAPASAAERNDDLAGHHGLAARAGAARAFDVGRRLGEPAKPAKPHAPKRVSGVPPNEPPPPKRAARRPARAVPRRALPKSRRRLLAPPASAATSTAFAAAIRSRRSPAARSAPACRSTRCWCRCSAPTRAPSSATT